MIDLAIAGIAGGIITSAGWFMVLRRSDDIVAGLYDDNEQQAHRLANATAQALAADNRAIDLALGRSRDSEAIESLGQTLTALEEQVINLTSKLDRRSRDYREVLDSNKLLRARLGIIAEAEKAGLVKVGQAG